jgi:tRNA-dependent cyclodipeptide synthase
MRIEKILDADIKDIENRRFNICIGISLGNKYFSKPRIKGFIEWAIKYTKNDVLVWVADTPHSVNFEILKGYTKERK